ncbi:Hpt domain-containing protein [Lutibacter oricola]|uniref:Hpt domain-containing protein n=1 Tax=Lutibacter oricola TaxID=762486 RepID=A0A1H3AGB5_9FLAO|nr:Hpt domain-containing protein [Lutibacter oricola]SDX28645.1 Hpt domain-containing protein [Lutibacter oricola]
MEKPNLLYIKELSGGDSIFENKMLEIVKQELPEEIKNYKNFLKKENFVNAADLVHKIKHKISVLGLKDGYQVAIDYEEELRQKKMNLQSKFEEILSAMIIFIKNA